MSYEFPERSREILINKGISNSLVLPPGHPFVGPRWCWTCCNSLRPLSNGMTLAIFCIYLYLHGHRTHPRSDDDD